MVFVCGQVASALQVKYADGEMERLGVPLFSIPTFILFVDILLKLAVYYWSSMFDVADVELCGLDLVNSSCSQFFYSISKFTSGIIYSRIMLFSLSGTSGS